MTKEEMKEYNKNYKLLHKETLKIKNKAYAALHKEERKEYNDSNKEGRKKDDKKYYSLNKKKIRKAQKEYRETNKIVLQTRKNIYRKKRTKSDPLYKLISDIRTLIRISIKQKSFAKTSKTNFILGCSYEEFKKHLELQFETWMNWNNHGVYNPDGERTWNIDHITPMASATTEEEVVRLNHYTNLRPLCSRENNEKGAKY